MENANSANMPMKLLLTGIAVLAMAGCVKQGIASGNLSVNKGETLRAGQAEAHLIGGYQRRVNADLEREQAEHQRREAERHHQEEEAKRQRDRDISDLAISIFGDPNKDKKKKKPAKQSGEGGGNGGGGD